MSSAVPAGNRASILSGLRVVDMSRLAPGPYCTMLLADLGAEVIAVGGGRAGEPTSSFSRGKQFIRLDLKAPGGQEALARLVETADVFVESFRPGVADRIGAGYERLSQRNPRLVYCSLTGYGQSGPLAQDAGHDLNYLALSGVLGAIGPATAPPSAPLNLLADFAGGSLLAAFGIVSALVERNRTNRGRYVDAAMIDGCLSLMTMHSSVWGTPVLPDRGRGLLGGGAPFYRCYVCADGRHVCVGALEPQFFAALWDTAIGGERPEQMDTTQWPAMEVKLAKAFLSRTRDEWTQIFKGTDACVDPVLSPEEAWTNEHIRHRHPAASMAVPPVVPRFGAEAAVPPASDTSDKTEQVLRSLGLSEDVIREAYPDSERNRVPPRTWPPKLKT